MPLHVKPGVTAHTSGLASVLQLAVQWPATGGFAVRSCPVQKPPVRAWRHVSSPKHGDHIFERYVAQPFGEGATHTELTQAHPAQS